MADHPDLQNLLRAWPYESGRLNVRLIRGLDGDPRLQIRLDLGILQMELTGRPDGERPSGFENLLEESKHELAEHRKETGSDDGYQLSPGRCQALREEVVQYYHRYISLMALKQYDGVVRDTVHNLEVIELCRRHGADDTDRSSLEQMRPHLLMMQARARIKLMIEANEQDLGHEILEDALERIAAHFTEIGDPDGFERSSEVQMLEEMRSDLEPVSPEGALEELHRRLDEAIMLENYELAAILRDEIRLMDDSRAR